MAGFTSTPSTKSELQDPSSIVSPDSPYYVTNSRHFRMLQAECYCRLQKPHLASTIVMLALITVSHYLFKFKKTRNSVSKLNFPSNSRIQARNAIEDRGERIYRPTIARSRAPLQALVSPLNCGFSCCGPWRPRHRHQLFRSAGSPRETPCVPPPGWRNLLILEKSSELARAAVDQIIREATPRRVHCRPNAVHTERHDPAL